MEMIIGIIVGLAVGGVACWLVQEFRAKSRTAALSSQHEADIAALKADHDKAVMEQQAAHNEAVAGLNVKVAGLEARLEQAASTQQMLETAKTQFSEVAKSTAAEALQINNQQFLDLAKENFGTTLETAQRELDQRHQAFQELVKPLSDQYSQLTDTFQNTTTTALQNNSKQFLELAQENWGKTLEATKSEFTQRHQQFQALVKPLADNYNSLGGQIKSLMENTQSVSTAATRLTAALSNNRVVGNWGEAVLDDIVEFAGLTGRSRKQMVIPGTQEKPDMVIDLPDGKSMIIDAKTSTEAYMQVQNAEDDRTLDDALKRHVAALKRQVNELAGKNYTQLPGALEFVVMFVPNEQFLTVALQADRELLRHAMQRRVTIVTPATLIALLWVVRDGWQQQEIAQNAEEISRLGSEMHGQVVEFLKSYRAVRNGIDETRKAFNDSLTVLQDNILGTAADMADLGVGDKASLSRPRLTQVPTRSGTLREISTPSDTNREAA